MEFLGSLIEYYCRRSVDMNPSISQVQKSYEALKIYEFFIE
jgi:hypothetical protein